MIEKIISGGQTGADLGGLKAAKKVGIKTGGFAPLGFKTEKGSNPELATVYDLIASSSDDYKIRTSANIRASHATIIFATNAGSAGTKLTLKTCEAAKKPYVLINPFAADASALVLNFLTEVHTRYKRAIILNVAGNRESKSPGIELRVEALLSELLLQ